MPTDNDNMKGQEEKKEISFTAEVSTKGVEQSES